MTPPGSIRRTDTCADRRDQSGQLPEIFGELITLIERDKRGDLATPQSGAVFAVPRTS